MIEGAERVRKLDRIRRKELDYNREEVEEKGKERGRGTKNSEVIA